MGGSTHRLGIAITLLAILVPPAGRASEAPQLRFREESSISWVLAPVVVRGPSGGARALRPEDFKLTVDDHPVPLMSFEAASDAPVRLIYLQDLSGSMANGGKLEGSRATLSCFLAGSRPGDEFALMSFASGQTSVDVPLTPDKSLLDSALQAWSGHGTTALHDAVARLPETLSASRSVRQAAVLVTDGADNASTLDPVEAREIARAAELPVYVLDLGPPLASGAIPGPDSFGHVLRLLASATGGRYHTALGKQSRRKMSGRKHLGRGGINQEDRLRVGMIEACQAMTEDLRHQYVLGFRTRDTDSPVYREIRVEIPKKKRFKLSHRQGYLGGPPSTK